jgi:hypothetical protein
MSEWSTYRLSDFLMFSTRTYRRLFELYNAEIGPAHVVAAGFGVLLLVGAAQRRPALARTAAGLLAAAWLWVAWAFHLERYATINTAAPWFALAFAVEAVALTGLALAGVRWRMPTAADPRRAIGLALIAVALFALPLVGAILGRPWTQAEIVGIAPDPTVVATLGALLLMRFDGDRAPRWRWVGRLAWPIPTGWCLVSGATLWTMEAPEAPLLPVLAAIALIGARLGRAPELDR